MKNVLKKFTYSLLILLLASTLFSPFTIRAEDVSENPDHKTNETDDKKSEEETVYDEDESDKKVEEVIPQDVLDYKLPYPGVLPDHPLYKLKLFRDQLLNFLIREPIKRIEFNLLMADKRLNMGVYLTEKEDYALAEETISKGEKYFVKAIDELYLASSNGREIPNEMKETLLLAIQKHRVVVEELKNKGPEDTRSGFNSSLSTISESHGRVAEFGM